MKAIAVCGSPRVGGNTEFLLQRCLDVMKGKGIEGSLVRLGEKTVKGCTGCGWCRKQEDNTCVIKDDDFHEVYEQMLDADIIVVGSPVYFGSATPEIMALLDRAGYVSRSNGMLFTRKIGGPLAVARRAGENFTYGQLLYWYMINGMVVPGSTYWNVAHGAAKGEVEQDTEGVQTIETFAENLAWVAQGLVAD